MEKWVYILTGFSILITVLMGWQIYQTINIERIISKRIIKMESDFEKKIEALQKDASSFISEKEKQWAEIAQKMSE